MKKNSNSGYIYVLTNSAMPGLVKIGKSVNGGKARSDQLFQTGVPSPFRVYFEMTFSDIHDAESRIHASIRFLRARKNREFFRMDAREAAQAVVAVWAEYQAMRLIDEEPYCALEELGRIASTIGAHPFEVFGVVDEIPSEAYRKAIDDRYAKHGIYVSRGGACLS